MKTLITFTLVSLMAQVATAQQAGQNTLTDADRVRIAVQKICPVSGSDLGSMGEPVKIQAGEQIAYLCCKGCQSKQINGDHWKTIQSRMAQAQGICPIMEKEVDASMESTVVNGQQIFVCCPPCIPQIQEDPKPSIEQVFASYSNFLASERQAESDQLHVLAQDICPVSGEKLGGKGEPVKVKVGKEEQAFLCCQSCVGKQISAEHWTTIQSNLAKAQGVCPVMEKEVDPSMESVIVNGRKIFVCCPPCIPKIKADSDAYIAKLNEQVAKNTDKK